MNIHQEDKNLLSLTYKVSIVDDNNFIISSYNHECIIVNNKNYFFPLCILGKEIFIWKNNDVSKLNPSLMMELLKRFLIVNKEKAEVIIIGLVTKKIIHLLNLKKKCMEKEIPIDIMKYDAACRTLNILNSENRKVISILI